MQQNNQNFFELKKKNGCPEKKIFRCGIEIK